MSKRGEWITAQQALVEIEKACPGQHAGKALANAAMKADFGTRASLAVFFIPGGNSLEKREQDFDVPGDWWWPEPDAKQMRGLQVVDLGKGEGWAIQYVNDLAQRVELFGLSFRRADLAAHFGIKPPVVSQSDGSQRRGPKPKYDWPAFCAYALTRLEHHGGFYGLDWRQSDLEREMVTWCESNWGEGSVPGESTIREKVAQVSAEYEARKSGQ